MKCKSLMFGAMGAAVIAVMAAGCGNNNGSSAAAVAIPPPVTSTTMALDTAQVLALAQVKSETSSPFPVDSGAFVFVDTSETTSPISVAQ
jgi:hypothetical protein